MKTRQFAVGAMAVLLFGCAGPGPKQMTADEGTPTEHLLVSLGAPTFELKLPNGGTRRFYKDDISFVHTWRADFDANGKVMNIAPATTSAEFGEIVPHVTTHDEIVARFGLPYSTDSAADGKAATMTYEFSQFGSWPVWIRFNFDRNGVLMRSDVQRIRDRGRSFGE